MRLGLVQLTASDDPDQNLPVTLEFVRDAMRQGAELVATPEVTNCVSASRRRQEEVLEPEDRDQTLSALREVAREGQAWVLIGSLALKDPAGDGRFVNRSFLIAPDGNIQARYDKIHMFDVAVSETETYRESAGYRPGDRAVLAAAGAARIGMTICYDLRFPGLYRTLARAGAQIISIPSAFSTGTGPAHWETLLRARAIETGSFVVAPAQTGRHAAGEGRARTTYGHSLVVSPWGEVLFDGGDLPGVGMVDLDLTHVETARMRIPSLTHDRNFGGPDE